MSLGQQLYSRSTDKIFALVHITAFNVIFKSSVNVAAKQVDSFPIFNDSLRIEWSSLPLCNLCKHYCFLASQRIAPVNLSEQVFFFNRQTAGKNCLMQSCQGTKTESSPPQSFSKAHNIPRLPNTMIVGSLSLIITARAEEYIFSKQAVTCTGLHARKPP